MIVLYPGGFDMLHRGHIAALVLARGIAGTDGKLIVGVNSDAFMQNYKRAPGRAQDLRVRDVCGTNLADEVVIWNGPENQDTQILAHRPDVYVAGTDWLGGDLAYQLRLPALSWFDDHGISLFYARRTPGISTTALIEGTAR